MALKLFKIQGNLLVAFFLLKSTQVEKTGLVEKVSLLLGNLKINSTFETRKRSSFLRYFSFHCRKVHFANLLEIFRKNLNLNSEKAFILKGIHMCICKYECTSFVITVFQRHFPKKKQ